MIDALQIRFSAHAEKAIRSLMEQDKERVRRIQGAIDSARRLGWRASTRTELVKVLDQVAEVCEIRDMGKGGYRLIDYWRDEDAARVIYLTHIEKKSGLTAVRLRHLVRAAAERRQRSPSEGGC